ncbi:MAG: transposase [Hormoscilla sp. SP5CHS1]|nr:transposase [Hormoscilla sp. SP5CHS1]MBC6472067.1 transposase [Hormoscilla sp. GM102CHS1]
MLTWAMGRFASHLEQAASRKGVLVVRCNEAYTSKNCPKCGHVHKKLGGSKIHKCPACGHKARSGNPPLREIG